MWAGGGGKEGGREGGKESGWVHIYEWTKRTKYEHDHTKSILLSLRSGFGLYSHRCHDRICRKIPSLPLLSSSVSSSMTTTTAGEQKDTHDTQT